ncbi:MAG: hypothetical protein WDM84_08970 [Bauldia sp.]
MLGYRPGWQSLADLNEIARHVSDLDPTIRTFIVPRTMRNSVSRKQAARLPTLVFSPGEMRGFSPLRGKVYHGWPMPKAEEVRRLTIAGVPVPRTVLLTPGLELDRAVVGRLRHRQADGPRHLVLRARHPAHAHRTRALHRTAGLRQRSPAGGSAR